MRILFLSSWYPFPADNGSKLRIHGLLQAIAERHQVTLLSFDTRVDAVEHAPELQALCQRIEVTPWKPFNPNGWRARLGYLSSKPRMVVDTFSAEMAQQIDRMLATNEYDVIVASQVVTALYSSYFRGIPAVFDELELGTYYDQFVNARGWRRFRYGLTWHKHRLWLANQLSKFGACTVVSENEYRMATQAIPNYRSFEVIPNSVNLEEYQDIQEPPKENSLVFTGSFSYYPNYEAMIWFIGKVFPIIQKQIPDIHLTITGKHSNFTLPHTNNVTLTGYVDDVRPYIARSWASVVPIHRGGGTRLKILEAMALRTPVIATPKGAEGIELQDGKHALIADTPDEFAQATIRLLQEPELRQRLADNAYALVKNRYDWKAITPRVLDLIERVATTSLSA